MQRNNKYWSSADLCEYICVGRVGKEYNQILLISIKMKEADIAAVMMSHEPLKIVQGNVYGFNPYILISSHININTTRDWATSKEMAIGNRIKLLDNEIVSLQVLRDSINNRSKDI